MAFRQSMMPCVAVALGPLVAAMGCNALWGVDELSYEPSAVGGAVATTGPGGHAAQGGVATAAAGGVGGSSGAPTGGAGAAGGATPCAPGAIENCYSGPSETLGVLPCQAGSRECRPDGSAWGPCVGEVVPTPEQCANGIDEDCSGADAPAAECLEDEGLLVRYFIDEASSGQAPNALADAAPNPLDLPIRWQAGFSFCETGPSRALCWAGAADDADARVSVGNTKIFDALDGATAMTIETVVIVEPFAGWTPLVRIVESSVQSIFALSCDSAGSPYLTWGASLSAQWDVDVTELGRTVLHMVLDTTEPVAADRVKLYVQGVLADTSSATPPAQGAALDLIEWALLVLGNNYAGTSPLDGAIGHLAIYTAPLTEAQVANNAALLLIDDDG